MHVNLRWTCMPSVFFVHTYTIHLLVGIFWWIWLARFRFFLFLNLWIFAEHFNKYFYVFLLPSHHHFLGHFLSLVCMYAWERGCGWQYSLQCRGLWWCVCWRHSSIVLTCGNWHWHHIITDITALTIFHDKYIDEEDADVGRD